MTVFGVLIGVVLVVLTGGLIALTYIPRICPECRKLVFEDTPSCPRCGHTRKPPRRRDSWQRTALERDPARPKPDEPLQAHIDWLVRKGFRVLSQTGSAAQLVRPKVFEFGWALLWFLLIAFGVLVYIFYYLSKKDETVYLSVQPDGSVRMT